MRRFDWNYDHEPYLVIRGEGGTFDMRPSNTMLYLFDDEHRHADHIFRAISENEEVYQGFRIWRTLIDKVLGEDSFDDMTAEMREHDFPVAPDREPSELDVKAWQDYTGQEYEPDYAAHDNLIVMRAVKNLDAHWRYVEPDWRAEQGYGTA